jgi:exonuclease SbcD
LWSYAGSALQLDFGEAGEKKSFVVLDVKPGRPAKISRVPYEGGTPLLDLRLTIPELEVREEELRSSGWLRVTVPLNEPDPDLARKLRERLPNALVIRPELPHQDVATVVSRNGKSPVEMYRDYHQREHGRHPDTSVEDTFQHLYVQSGD